MTSQLTAGQQADEFVRLFGLNARRVYSYIRTLLPHSADAEEVFQETNVVLWEKFDQFEPGTNFGAWACRIAHFKVLNLLQQRKRETSWLGGSLLEQIGEQAVEMASELNADHQALADCLDKLSEADRRLIHRRYSDSATVKRVALELGRSPATAYRALERIHEALFRCIERTRAMEQRA